MAGTALGRGPTLGDRDIFCGPVITAIPAPFAGTLAGAVPTCNFRPEIGEGLLGDIRRRYLMSAKRS